MADDETDADDLVNARLAAIVESSFDAIVSKDLNSVIRTWNAAAERLFGYTPEEAIGRSVLMLIPDGLRGEEDDIIGRIRSGDRVASFETIRRRKDGSLVAVSLTVSPIRDSRGNIVGASKIARDISAAKENERRIKMLMREVNHRVKNQFAVILAMVRETTVRTRDPTEIETRIRDRIMALSRSQDLLVTSDWTGADLEELIWEHLRPFGHEDRVTVAGPAIALRPNAVQYLGMAFHELGTNAAKYGALSESGGTVAIAWRFLEDIMHLVWEETSDSSAPVPKDGEARSGFGAVVLRRVTPKALDGLSNLTQDPGKLTWTLEAPLKSVRRQDTDD